MSGNFLFIGAHPDDIEFGAGASIAKARASGVTCYSAIFSDCKETLDKLGADKNQIVNESIEAHNVLGVSRDYMIFFDFPVRYFHLHRQDILQKMFDDLQNFKWDKVFIPNGHDIHQDHSVICNEAKRVFKNTTLLGYELPWNNYSSNARYFNLIEEVFVQQKASAISHFTSQKSKFYSKPEHIVAPLRFRGLQILSNYAEAFEIFRIVSN
jgi:LmbE family N-acetylglucosaminyl deacetylase